MNANGHEFQTEHRRTTRFSISVHSGPFVVEKGGPVVVPTLHFKGEPLVQNHHLVVPFSELEAVKSRERDVFLIYEQDIEKLKDMALNLDLARKLGKAERKKLVFAPTKYLDQEYLDRLNIEFCQLPFEIYQRATKK